MLKKSLAALLVALGLSLTAGVATAAADTSPDMTHDGFNPDMTYDGFNPDMTHD
jgi:hypothetical protein